jgi:hypothetical protein
MDRATQKIDMPAGGIGDFIYTDEELDILEAKELEEAFGKDGIAQFKDVGKKIAEYGRYGDDTVAHVETGELIVPRALIENNPELKESIFSHLKELGVEDPERYVVGTKKNSINPDTGLPEFFLSKLFKGIKKGVSKIGKGVSRALKGVGKALKKVAPVVLPIVLGMTPLGPIYGAALGSGISTLMQGGDLGDAVKSAALAGGVGAIYSGASSAIAGKGFGAGISADLASPGARFSQTLSDPFSSYQPTAAQNLIKSDPAFDTNVDLTGLDGTKKIAESKSTLDTIGDFLTGGPNVTPAEILKKENPNIDLSKVSKNSALYLDAVEKAKNASPGFIRRFGPTAGLAGLGLAAAGAFDAPEQERLDIPESGLDIYNRSPETYNVAGMTPNLATGPFRIPTNYTFNYTPYRLPTDPFKKGDPPVFIPPFQRAAEGGEIFPRRNGGIGPNEGTPGKDSVRAMLMPGEFVMTTDAVKGLGNGDLNTGIKNMYSVMSKLEKKGKAMA